MLAIATTDPDSVAATFVRQHIRCIAPGHTVVAFTDGGCQSITDLPHLRVEDDGTSGFRGRVKSAFSFCWHGYPGAIKGKAKDSVVSFFKSHSVSCLLAEFGPTACAFLPVCKSMKLPLFAFFHGHDVTVSGRSAMYRLSYSRMGRFASGVFVASKYFARRVAEVGVPEQKIRVIPYGVDANAFLPAKSRDPHLVVAVGRFVEKKAPHLTIQAFSEVLRACPDARLEMVGSGPLLSTCQQIATDLGIGQKVLFHGSREHEFVRQLVRRATVFVQHSVTAPNGDTESLGISLLEAMASEVPIVVTRHNGFVETVVDGETGFLVDEHDIAGMARKIVTILRNPAAAEQMGKASRARVLSHYSREVEARKLRDAMRLPKLDALPTCACP